MPPVQTTVKCPNCGAPQPANVDQIIDVAHDPAAKTRLLENRWNFFQCPACGFQGSLVAPLVYHDPAKELLLTFVPSGLRMDPMEQEKLLGWLTQQVVQSLPAELRKGYLLRPRAMLTMQGMIEHILEADGITREMLEERRAKTLLVRELMGMDAAVWPDFIARNDSKIDADVLALLGAYGRAASAQGDEAAAQKFFQAREAALQHSSAGKRAQAQKAEFDQAARDLEALGDKLSLDSLVQLVAAAPSLDRVSGLSALAWQVMDYSFFQRLTEKVEQAAGSERERLTAIRDRALEEIQRIQTAVQSEMSQTAALLHGLLQAPDVDRAIEEILPDMNDLFFAVLEANLESARREQKTEIAARLEDLKTRILAALDKTLPAEIRFLRDLMQKENDAAAEQLLQERSAEVTDELIEAMDSSIRDLRTQNREDLAARMEKLKPKAEKLRALARFGATQTPAGPG
jgi:predicted RNA-binding Zn-ribbon protein involved in translation (DUF1610 family)